MVFAAALALFTTLLAAQQPIPPDELSLHAAPYVPMSLPGTIQAQTDLVEVPVVVRDGKGTAVRDLQREDFELFDSGVRREISSFSVEKFPPAGKSEVGGSPTPSEYPKRYIAIVLDDLNTDAGNLHRAKLAAQNFVEHSLTPGDMVGVFTTALSETVTFTADVEKLKRRIDEVMPHPRYTEDQKNCPSIGAYEAYLISNNLDPRVLAAKAADLQSCTRGGMTRDAAEQAVRMLSGAIWETAKFNNDNTLHSMAEVVRLMSAMPGQRIVLWASVGFVPGEREQWMEELTRLALHNRVVVNALDLKGLYATVIGGEVKNSRPMGLRGPADMAVQVRSEESKSDGMAILALGTGGQFFHNNNDVDAGFRRLGALPGVMYVLGFQAGDVVHDGKYHELKVRLAKGRHGTIQARMGYTAPPREDPADVTRQRDRDSLLLSQETSSDLPVQVTAEAAKSESGPKVGVRALLEVSRLDFERKQDRRKDRVTVIAALIDETGNFVAGRQAVTEMALKDTSYDALRAVGLTIALSLHAPKGSYQLRVLIEDANTRKVTAITRTIALD